MKKLFKKFNLSIISLVFALTLCFGGIALSAPKKVDAAEYVAQANSTQYATLKEAFDSAKDGEQTNVKLLADVTTTEIIQIAAEKNVVFNLNGFNLINPNDGVFRILGTFCIKGNGSVKGASEGATISTINVGQTGTLVLEGGTITSLGGTGNRCIYSQGTVTINGGSIENGSAENGGGIYSSGTLTINGGTISNNRATSGGGIFSQGTVTINGGEISNNTADDGGGIYSTGGTLTISDGTISYNTANNGGGIYAVGYCKVDITNGAIEQNNAVNDGGGIFFAKGRLKMTGGTILSNTAGSNGGGIFNVSDNSNTNLVEIAGGVIESNTAEGNGGGIFNSIDTSKGNLSISGSAMITKNQSNNGAGIYNDGGVFSAVGGTVLQNVAKSGGGGIFNNYGTIDVTRITISGNSATNGGGIFANNGTINIKYNTFISQNTARFGGGVYSDSCAVTVTDATITQNTATDEGGGIYIYIYANVAKTVDIQKTTISSNKATSLGGGIHVNSGIVNIGSDVLITTNSAEYGGGIFLEKNSTIAINGATVSENTAKYQGGGISCGGKTTIENATISKNKSVDGAGIFSAGEVEINSTTFEENIATSDGGGVYANIDILKLNSCLISKNTAYDGAGIFNKCTLTIDGGEITDNIAKNYGGGVLNDETGTLTVDSATISDNTASIGGGIYNKASLTVNSATISDNTASIGGGVYNKASLTVEGGTISLNNATDGDGGGIYNNGTLTVTDSTITENTANNGGGIYNEGTLTMSGVEISQNTATAGGGIFNYGEIDLTDSKITQNIAQENGGGVFNYEGATFMASESTLQQVSNNGDFVLDGGSVASLFVGHENSTAAITGQILTVYFEKIPTQPVGLVCADLQHKINVIVNVNSVADIEDKVLFKNFAGNDNMFKLNKGTVDNHQPVDDYFLHKNQQNNVAVTLVDVAEISVTTQPTKTTYIYDQPFEKDGMVVTARYNNGKIEVIDNNKITVVYTNENSFHPTDTGVTLQYTNLKNQNITCELDGLVINKKPNEISSVVIGVWTYGDDRYSFSYSVDFSDGGVTTYADSEDGEYTKQVPKQAGTYWLKIFIPESEFYTSATHIEQISILPKQVYVSLPDSKAYNGQKQVADVSTSDEYTVVNEGGTNIGIYPVTYSLKDKANYVWFNNTTDDLHYNFEITKGVVVTPNIDNQSVVYNGQKQVATVVANDLYTATNDGGTNVGTYPVTYSLNDKANYNWSTGNADDLTFEFSIAKATATIGDVSVLGNVRGEDLQINATSNFGDIQYSYAKKGESNFSSTKPTKPGEYIAKITVAGTNNFDGAEKTVEFVIESKLFAGEIVGIVAGSVAVAGGIGVGIWFLIKKRKRI